MTTQWAIIAFYTQITAEEKTLLKILHFFNYLRFRTGHCPRDGRDVNLSDLKNENQPLYNITCSFTHRCVL
jgi:hypothetical protein